MPRLTTESVRRRKPTERRAIVSDSTVRGLYLVIEPTGCKRFLLRYKVHNRTHRYALGRFGEEPGLLTLDAARALAADWRERIRRGDRPHDVLARAREVQALERSARNAQPTLTDLATLFRRKYLEQQTRRPDHRLISFNRWMLPALGAMKLTDIRRRHLNAALDEVTEAGHGVTAYGLARLLGQMFRFAVDEELLEVSPAERLRKGTQHTIGDRVLTDAELPLVWSTLDRADIPMSEPVRIALKLLLLTGARSGELCAARWDDVRTDGDMPQWTIPRTATKTGAGHVVPLGRTAAALFGQLLALTGDSGFVLPGKRSGHLVSHVVATALRRCHQAGAFGNMPAFGAHDLRRTMRTGLARLGVPAELAERVIGHKPRSTLIQTYDLYDRLPERRKILLDWDAEVRRILGAQSRVTRLARHRA